jgi:hypothetical protein
VALGKKEIKIMKSFGFSFRREPFWMMAFSFAPPVVGLLIALVVLIVKLAR